MNAESVDPTPTTNICDGLGHLDSELNLPEKVKAMIPSETMGVHTSLMVLCERIPSHFGDSLVQRAMFLFQHVELPLEDQRAN